MASRVEMFRTTRIDVGDNAPVCSRHKGWAGVRAHLCHIETVIVRDSHHSSRAGGGGGGERAKREKLKRWEWSLTEQSSVSSKRVNMK